MLKIAKNMFMAMLFFAACSAFALKVGDRAPELQGVQWVKNGPVDISKGKDTNVYVIEFWATWCPPCKVSIPHLSGLQEKYKKQGLIIAGISDEDLKTVKDFVDNASDMNYNVAINNAGRTYGKYMEGIDGIPTAFVVDKKGIIVWIGHPMELDGIIEGILTGKEIAKRQDPSLQERMQTALFSKNYAEAMKIDDELMQDNPNNVRAIGLRAYILIKMDKGDQAIDFINEKLKQLPDNGELHVIKFNALNQLKRFNEIEAQSEDIIKNIKDPMILNNLVWMMVNTKLGNAQLKPALQMAEKAYFNGTFSSDEQKPMVADTLALCYYLAGRIDKAIELEQAGVDLCKNTKQKQQYSKMLQYYQNALAINKNIK